MTVFLFFEKKSGLRTPWLPPRAGSRASGRDDGFFIRMTAFALFVVIPASSQELLGGSFAKRIGAILESSHVMCSYVVFVVVE